MIARVVVWLGTAVVVWLVLGLFSIAWAARPAVRGQGLYDLDPALPGVQPTVFSFDRSHFICAVSFGTMGAAAPGPFSEPAMKLKDVNFAMVVTATKVKKFTVEKKNKTVTMEGTAQSVTTVNDAIAENATYRFVVTAVDKGPGSADTTVLRLFAPKGVTGLLFDQHSFGTTQGLLQGDIMVP